jgi:hypothetical protein
MPLRSMEDLMHRKNHHLKRPRSSLNPTRRLDQTSFEPEFYPCGAASAALHVGISHWTKQALLTHTPILPIFNSESRVLFCAVHKGDQDLTITGVKALADHQHRVKPIVLSSDPFTSFGRRKCIGQPVAGVARWSTIVSS